MELIVKGGSICLVLEDLLPSSLSQMLTRDFVASCERPQFSTMGVSPKCYSNVLLRWQMASQRKSQGSLTFFSSFPFVAQPTGKPQTANCTAVTQVVAQTPTVLRETASPWSGNPWEDSMVRWLLGESGQLSLLIHCFALRAAKISQNTVGGAWNSEKAIFLLREIEKWGLWDLENEGKSIREEREREAAPIILCMNRWKSQI